MIVGMLDSIHIARWLGQFENTEVDIYLFPSSHFRKIHPKILHNGVSKIHILGARIFGMNHGYVDSLITLRFLGNVFAERIRCFYLKIVISVIRPEVIHAIEIQHAGYLVSSLSGSAERRIVTNWGSDIYFFQHDPEHEILIKKTLKWATHYSAECQRDYKLASDLGFTGIELPKIPNAGGFDEFNDQIKCSARKLILVKSYGGQFGAGKLAIKALDLFLKECKDFQVFLYSVTPDLLPEVENLQLSYPNLVSYATLKNPISHEDLMKIFLSARIYLGCSLSDGLSTSFLQALNTGAYPIQTNTSCASELILQGASGSIISPNAEEIFSELRNKIFDTFLLDQAQKTNLDFSVSHLNKRDIGRIAQSFYLL